MKVRFGMDIICDAWKVTRDEAPEQWVQELLDKNQLVWKKDLLGIFIRPNASVGQMSLLGQIVLSNTGGGFLAGQATKAYVGQYLVRRADNSFYAHDEKQFHKEYKKCD